LRSVTRLEELAAEFADAARLKGITFRIASGVGAAHSHPVLLTGMLRNLIRNAIDYTPPGGSVFVTFRRCGPELCISLRDTGAGIRANALSAIFRAFQRANDSRPVSASGFSSSSTPPICSGTASKSARPRGAARVSPSSPSRLGTARPGQPT
jgi:signal transduction histidine kinase